MVVISLNLLDPVLDAMEQPQPEPTRAPPRRICSWSIRIRIAWAKSLPNIRSCRSAMSMFRDRRCATVAHGGPPPRADGAVSRGRSRPTKLNTGEKMHRWQRRLLARYSRNLARHASTI